MTQTECAPHRCSSLERCQNQVIQKKAFPPTSVLLDATFGRALQVNAEVQQGTKIVEYVGEYIGRSEYVKRKNDPKRESKFYTARVGSGGDLFVDASEYGNHSRFINHSCIPNCRLQTWYVDTKPRLIVVANCKLEKGTILSLSYMDASWGIPCKCGACDGRYNIFAYNISSDSDSM
jgi:histone-lysine N-methyltransferase SETD2